MDDQATKAVPNMVRAARWEDFRLAAVALLEQQQACLGTGIAHLRAELVDFAAIGQALDSAEFFRACAIDSVRTLCRDSRVRVISG